MDSSQSGICSQHRHYPDWYEGTLSTWPLMAKYPRRFRASIGLPEASHLTPLLSHGIPRTGPLQHDEIVAVHQFGFGDMAQDRLDFRRGLTHDASRVG